MMPSLNQKPMKLRLVDTSKLNHLKAIPLRLRKKDQSHESREEEKEDALERQSIKMANKLSYIVDLGFWVVVAIEGQRTSIEIAASSEFIAAVIARALTIDEGD